MNLFVKIFESVVLAVIELQRGMKEPAMFLEFLSGGIIAPGLPRKDWQRTVQVSFERATILHSTECNFRPNILHS